MKSLIERLELVLDLVIIDAPPLLLVTDAAVLSQHVRGVVVVVGSHKVRQQELARTLEALHKVDASVLGIILNRLPGKGPDAYAYSYYTNDVPSQSLNAALDRNDSDGSKRYSEKRNEMLGANGADWDSDNFDSQVLSGAARRPSRFPRSLS